MRKKSSGKPLKGWIKTERALVSRLHELKGMRLHVWMEHHLRGDRDTAESYPSLVRAAGDTGYSQDKVCRTRKYLQKMGWLILVGHREDTSGQFKVPIFKAVIPEPLPKTDNGDDGTKDTTAPGTESTTGVVPDTGTAKSPTEQDTSVSQRSSPNSGEKLAS